MQGFRVISMVSIIVWLLISGCGNQVVFQTSKITPAAEGNAKVKELKNGNYSVIVTVNNLAESDRLDPSRKYYVVWNQGKDGTYNLGQIKLNKEMEGFLETETTYNPKRILISAEDDEKATKPGKQIVLKSKKF